MVHVVAEAQKDKSCSGCFMYLESILSMLLLQWLRCLQANELQLVVGLDENLLVQAHYSCSNLVDFVLLHKLFLLVHSEYAEERKAIQY